MLAADHIFTGGNLLTLEPRRPRATAMAIRDGWIAAVGSDREIEALAGPDTQRVALGGKTLTPGFCDSHVHFLSYGAQLLNTADLVGSANVEDVLGRLRELARRRGSDGWLQGFGFDQDKMRERRFPMRDELDRVSQTQPIIISRICGHASVVNSTALAMINDEERRAGDPESGLYTENAVNAFYRRIPTLDDTEMQQAVLAAAEVALRTGITSIHTLLDTPDQLRGYASLKRRTGTLPLRVVGIPPYDAIEALHAHGIATGFGDDWLRVGGCKLFSDGSLGAQTAWLSEPYADKPSTRGIRIYEPDELKRRCLDAQRKGFQLAIHAIGDEALRETLDAIEFALSQDTEHDGDNASHRHRVEHASMCPPDCLERMARRRIVATLQPQFVTSDTWTPARVGPKRVPWCYPFKSMLHAGVPVTLSSDCPVEKMDAFQALASAVERHAWSPDETLTPEEAIRAYCLGSAYAAHMEDRAGSLEVGKPADFVVLSGDPTRMNADQIRSLRAEQVYVGGTLRR